METQFEVVKLEITKLELKLGDILAVKCDPNKVLRSEIVRLREVLVDVLPPGVNFIILDTNGVELSVITPPQSASA